MAIIEEWVEGGSGRYRSVFRMEIVSLRSVAVFVSFLSVLSGRRIESFASMPLTGEMQATGLGWLDPRGPGNRYQPPPDDWPHCPN